jgi:hypothetical protein
VKDNTWGAILAVVIVLVIVTMLLGKILLSINQGTDVKMDPNQLKPPDVQQNPLKE